MGVSSICSTINRKKLRKKEEKKAKKRATKIGTFCSIDNSYNINPVRLIKYITVA
jgi:hypothetical protein